MISINAIFSLIIWLCLPIPSVTSRISDIRPREPVRLQNLILFIVGYPDGRYPPSGLRVPEAVFLLLFSRQLRSNTRLTVSSISRNCHFLRPLKVLFRSFYGLTLYFLGFWLWPNDMVNYRKDTFLKSISSLIP